MSYCRLYDNDTAVRGNTGANRYRDSDTCTDNCSTIDNNCGTGGGQDDSYTGSNIYVFTH
jgi:hypothetical protein